MKKVRRGLVWLFMIWKRMFKKPGYVLLLLTIALLAISLSVFSQNSGSLVRIAIFADNEETKDVFLESENTTTVIKYEYFESEQSAYDAVTAQGYDAAWILTGDLFDASREFTRNGEPIVRIFQREDTVFLRLSREKLYATIYPYISKAIYDGFMTETFPDADREVTDDYYNRQSEARPIFEVKFNNSEQKISDLDILSSPIRGILAVAVFLCSYAAVMSFKKDRDGGLFSRSPEGCLIYIEAAYILISTLNAGFIALVCMWLTGIFIGVGIEILLMTVYVMLCTASCIVIGELTERLGVMGALIPILAILMLVICPVFINIVHLPQIQLLLPPFYYLSAIQNGDYIAYSVIYIISAVVVYALIRLMKYVILHFKFRKEEL